MTMTEAATASINAALMKGADNAFPAAFWSFRYAP